ncbi:hypothetical protein [Paraburkholderia phenoliruptrix]|uniref:hypothetical protein n=1 Tax=Paraburkholderia phenoliruptrix TaxID=252970 RepID=UPI002869DF20|nr:hypothetical protein [Paraburkholderia phenoliruptrix]WMY10918.1 hypothetical protein P3F88_30005 [Paraburkholderia phenoliruptrix]
MPLFDPRDLIAWYVFQANAYAQERRDWFEPEAFRIAPVFRRLGQLVPQLEEVAGAMERVEKIMKEGKSQPDDGLFELLVAGAYKTRSWPEVQFVPERPGIAKTHDLFASRGRSRWAVECKRVNRSGYESEEYGHGLRVARTVHELCRSRRRSLVLEVVFEAELANVSDEYLAERADAFITDSSCTQWEDDWSHGRVREVEWHTVQSVLQRDDVFFGSSRMVELLVGRYVQHVDHSVASDWIPARGRPLYATAVNQASVISWMSNSQEAMSRKARHFRSIVARASEQLPADCPSAIHVGYEARDGNSVGALRHELNRIQMRSFDPKKSRLRWVYGNYLSPEHTNHPNESSALSETTATYKIGRHSTSNPLPNHLLFNDDPGVRGHHWRW